MTLVFIVLYGCGGENFTTAAATDARSIEQADSGTGGAVEATGGAPAGTGGSSTGGAVPGTGGKPELEVDGGRGSGGASTGGTPVSTGGAPLPPPDGGPTCAQQGGKICDGVCMVGAGPDHGCSTSSCSACVIPAHSVAVCNAGGSCSFMCSMGYVRVGGLCCSVSGC